MTDDLERKSVLLVDDEKLVRLTIASWLKTTDIELTAVGTTAEASELVRARRFDVIVTDVMMEGMDGFMFRDYVRSVNREIPVIFLTSLVNDADNLFMRKVMADCNSYYVPKDSPREYLVGKIEQVVRAARAEVRLASMNRELEKSLRLAGAVQRSMLPSWCHVSKSYYYGTLWHPYEVVSGDVAYWHPIGEDAFLAVLGDVSGHGVSAAMAMSSILAYLKGFDTWDDARCRDVRGIAERIDRFVAAHLKGMAYMTATVFYFNTRERVMRSLAAGSIDFLCFRRDTGAEIVLNPEKRGCPPLGLLERAVIREEDVLETAVPENAVLLFLSDGLCDLSSDEAGEERVSLDLIKELAAEVVKDPRNGLCAVPFQLYKTLNALGYVHSHDDISCVSFGLMPGSEGEFGFEVRMSPSEIDQGAMRLGDYVRSRCPDCEALAVKAELLLNEHLMNVHDHGLDDYARTMEKSLVRAYFERDFLVVTIWDRGKAWTGQPEMRSRAEQRLDDQNESLATHGRGEAIVRRIAVRLSRKRLLNLNRSVYYLPLAEETEGASGHEG